MKKTKRIILIVISCIVIIALNVYNAIYVNPYQLKIRLENIRSDKIPNNLDGLTLAYFSDVYFNEGLDKSYFDTAISTLTDINADIVIFGGDLASHSLNAEDESYITSSLKNINAKIGKYYVLGNYDIENKEQINNIFSSSGFKLLDNSYRKISYNNGSFNLVGLNSIDLDSSCLANLDDSFYTLVVSHYPDTFERIKDISFDLMLAGHSLGGPINLPIISSFNKPLGAQKNHNGKHSYNNKKLDITNGIGLTEKNSARLFADAEIVLYKLNSSN